MCSLVVSDGVKEKKKMEDELVEIVNLARPLHFHTQSHPHI